MTIFSKEERKEEMMRMKKMMRKGMTMVLALAMVLSLAGCGAGGKSGGTTQKDLKELVYRAEILPVTEQIKGDIANYAVHGDEIYIYSSEWIEEEGGSDQILPKESVTEEEVVEVQESSTPEETEEDSQSETDSQEEGEDGGEASGEQEAESQDQNADKEAVEDTEEKEETEDLLENETSESTGDDTVDSEIMLDDMGENYTYTVNRYFYKMKLDGTGLTTLKEELDCGQSNEWLNNFVVAENGDLYMFYNVYNPTNETNEYVIHILDAEGKEKDMFSLTDMISEEDGYVQTMCMDKQQNMYVLTDQVVFVIGTDGAELFQVKLEGWASGMTVMNDGSVIVSTHGDDSFEMKVVDCAAKDWGKSYKMDQSFYGVNSLIAGNGAYSFYYNDNSNLCGYDVETGKSTEILNWVSSNISASYVNNIVATGDGNFLCSYYDSTLGDEATSALYMLKKVDPSEVADKTIVTYAGVYVDDLIKTQAVKFNKGQDQYQVVVKDYSASEDAIKDMNADLLAGNIPDIIDLNNLNVEKYIAKGMLTDLYTFMENDPDIKKEDFQENILKLMETDGKLYRISPTFAINTMVGKTKDVKGKTTFTIDDLIQLEQQYGKDVKAFHMCSNTYALSKLCSANYSYYIDWNTGKCNFDGEDFIKILEYANTYPSDEDMDWENYTSLPTMLRENKCIFAEVYNLSMEEIQLYSEMFQEDISFVGYPAQGATGPAVNLNSNVGIYAKSSNQEGAWTFLKTFLTEEYLEGKGSYFYGGFPLRKDAFEDEVKKYSTKETYTDKFGNEILPLDSSWGYDDIEVKIGPLSDEQVEKVREILATADHLYNYDDEILNIITEEAGAYFSGQKSAKDVADIIQNRVSTYVNENR